MTWTVATKQAEIWAAKAREVETWTPSTIGVQLWGSGDAPSILSISPESGASGALLTITGENFLTVTSVTIDGVEADFTIVSDTTITATVP